MTDTAPTTEELRRAILKMNALLSRLEAETGATTNENIESFINAVLNDVMELPDRSSPDDWPLACLVEGDELDTILRERIPLLIPQNQEVEPAPQPTRAAPVAAGDEDEALETLIENVAKGIAKNGFGREWDDFSQIGALDTDQGDLMDYARAAIEAYQSSAPQPRLSQDELQKIIQIRLAATLYGPISTPAPVAADEAPAPPTPLPPPNLVRLFRMFGPKATGMYTLPCPFCGGEDIAMRMDYEDGIRRPECTACGGSCGNLEMDESEIIQRWNTRAAPTPKPAPPTPTS